MDATRLRTPRRPGQPFAGSHGRGQNKTKSKFLKDLPGAERIQKTSPSSLGVADPASGHRVSKLYGRALQALLSERAYLRPGNAADHLLETCCRRAQWAAIVCVSCLSCWDPATDRTQPRRRCGTQWLWTIRHGLANCSLALLSHSRRSLLVHARPGAVSSPVDQVGQRAGLLLSQLCQLRHGEEGDTTCCASEGTCWKCGTRTWEVRDICAALRPAQTSANTGVLAPASGAQLLPVVRTRPGKCSSWSFRSPCLRRSPAVRAKTEMHQASLQVLNKFASSMLVTLWQKAVFCLKMYVSLCSVVAGSRTSSS